MRQQRRILVVAATPSRILDVIGAAEVFLEANRLEPEQPAYDLRILSVGEGDLLEGHGGLHVRTEQTYREHVGDVDTLLVVGTGGPAKTRYTTDFLEWLRSMSEASRRMAAVSAGAFALAQAGLLDGRQATTHWQWCEELSRSHPKVQVKPGVLYVQDGQCYTSAGATAGIDLALALVEDDLGSSVAMKVAQNMLIFLRRTGSQPQLSVTLSAQSAGGPCFSDLLAWMTDNIHGDLSVSNLARRVAMSPRNFARQFVREVGTTPGKHIRALRLEAARRVLESGSRSLSEVAGASGFASAETLRRAFIKGIGVTPGRYRAVQSQQPMANGMQGVSIEARGGLPTPPRAAGPLRTLSQ